MPSPESTDKVLGKRRALDSPTIASTVDTNNESLTAQPTSSSDDTRSLTQLLSSVRLNPDPLRRGVQTVIDTGRLPGAPPIHKLLADYVEYARDVLAGSISVAEAITPQELMYFAQGLPLFSCESTMDSIEVDSIDLHNLAKFAELLPETIVSESNTTGQQYHVNATYHSSKLLLVASANPRAIEWLFMVAILVQRGMRGRVIEMLLDRKDRFILAMHKNLDQQMTNQQIMHAVVSFSAVLERVITNVVTSMESLEMGELTGGQMTCSASESKQVGALPDLLEFDYYVTSDTLVYSVAVQAQRLGCTFHSEPLLASRSDIDDKSLGTRSSKKRKMMVPPALPEASGFKEAREIRSVLLSASPQVSHYHLISAGSTGRIQHARLISGLVELLRSHNYQNLIDTLSTPARLCLDLAVDLSTGIADLLSDENGKLQLTSSCLNVGSLPTSVPVGVIGNILHSDLFKEAHIDFLDFHDILRSDVEQHDEVLAAYLAIRGWLWAQSLITDLPTHLYIPKPWNFMEVLALIGATMLHLENQDSGYLVTSNVLFRSLGLLTNSGGDLVPSTTEAVCYACQGPVGTLVHDILTDTVPPWASSSFLAYRWLQGKFLGIPEVAWLANAVIFMKELPIILPSVPEAAGPSLSLRRRGSGSGTAVVVFADATEGHTLSCAIVTEAGHIRVLPFSRILLGVLLARIFDSKCMHDAGNVPVETFGATSLPWSLLEQGYFGRGEIPDHDKVVIVDTNDKRPLQSMALGVVMERAAITTTGCLECAFDHSNHVIFARHT